MKAILFINHGDTGVLEYSDYPTPDPCPGQVMVRIRATALNRLDLWVRKGWHGLELEYPHIPGTDGAGEVASLDKIYSQAEAGAAQERLAGGDQMGKITLAVD